MEISGFTPLTIIDYPNEIAAGIYTQGCNMRCKFCHNKHLIEIKKGIYSWEYIRGQLIFRQGFVSAVTFSGGEPTLQTDLINKIKEVREIGYLIGLHTNGILLTKEIAEQCDYILLSKADQHKISIASKAKLLSVSIMRYTDDKWINDIIPIK